MEQLSTPQELPSIDDFMSRLGEALGEAPAMHDAVKFVITTLHRDQEDQAATCLTLFVNEDEGVCATSVLSTDQILELIDLMVTNPEARLPKFGLDSIKAKLMDIFNGESDAAEQSYEIAQNIDERAAYQGLVSEVIMTLGPIAKYEVTLNVSAEYFLDTTEADREILRQRGIDHIHEPTIMNHREVVLSMTAASMNP